MKMAEIGVKIIMRTNLTKVGSAIKSIPQNGNGVYSLFLLLWFHPIGKMDARERKGEYETQGSGHGRNDEDDLLVGVSASNGLGLV